MTDGHDIQKLLLTYHEHWPIQDIQMTIWTRVLATAPQTHDIKNDIKITRQKPCNTFHGKNKIQHQNDRSCVRVSKYVRGVSTVHKFLYLRISNRKMQKIAMSQTLHNKSRAIISQPKHMFVHHIQCTAYVLSVR